MRLGQRLSLRTVVSTAQLQSTSEDLHPRTGTRSTGEEGHPGRDGVRPVVSQVLIELLRSNGTAPNGMSSEQSSLASQPNSIVAKLLNHESDPCISVLCSPVYCAAPGCGRRPVDLNGNRPRAHARRGVAGH